MEFVVRIVQYSVQLGRIEAVAEFWDTHNLTGYGDETTEVEFDVDLTTDGTGGKKRR